MDVAGPPLPHGHAPAVVVWGPDDEARLRVAAALHNDFLAGRGGASLGAGPPGAGRAYAAPGLERTIDQLLTSGGQPRTSPSHRHAVLREWLARRIASVGTSRRVGATDDRLNRFADVLADAWDDPVVVLVGATPPDSDVDTGGFSRVVRLDGAIDSPVNQFVDLPGQDASTRWITG